MLWKTFDFFDICQRIWQYSIDFKIEIIESTAILTLYNTMIDSIMFPYCYTISVSKRDIYVYLLRALAFDIFHRVIPILLYIYLIIIFIKLQLSRLRLMIKDFGGTMQYNYNYYYFLYIFSKHRICGSLHYWVLDNCDKRKIYKERLK